VELTELHAGSLVLDVDLKLVDASGRTVSEYRRDVYRSVVESDAAVKVARAREEVNKKIERERQER
jgi:hypothetical protein